MEDVIHFDGSSLHPVIQPPQQQGEQSPGQHLRTRLAVVVRRSSIQDSQTVADGTGEVALS